MPEKITFLVTNYNNANYIEDCLDSIVNQTNPDWDCWVIDDCSTDDSIDKIKKYLSSKTRLIVNDSNIGQFRSIVKLFDYVKTDIVGIVDSDDAVHQDTTKHLLDAFSKSSRIGLVYTNCIEYKTWEYVQCSKQ